jgi:hypothetical protein
MEEVIFGKKNSRRYLLGKESATARCAVRPGGSSETLRCEKARQALANSELVLHIETPTFSYSNCRTIQISPNARRYYASYQTCASLAAPGRSSYQRTCFLHRKHLPEIRRSARSDRVLVILDELGLTIKQRFYAINAFFVHHTHCRGTEVCSFTLQLLERKDVDYLTRKYCARGNAERSMTTNGT